MPTFRFPTDPPADYPFTCAGIDPGRAKRLLEQVSGRIPPGEREALRTFWQGKGNAPTIAIEGVFTLSVKRDDGEHVALGHNTLGVSIRYAGKALDAMDDDTAERLIAHELGHSVLERRERQGCLPPADAAVIKGLDEELQAVMGDGLDFDEDAVRNKLIEQLKPRTAWIEPAVNRETKSWDARYDDKPVRDWLAYHVKHKSPPPKPEGGPQPTPPPEPSPDPAGAAGADSQG